jgi:hypothetical protein
MLAHYVLWALLAREAAWAEDVSAEDVVRDAMRAHGGVEKLERLKAFQIRARGVMSKANAQAPLDVHYKIGGVDHVEWTISANKGDGTKSTCHAVSDFNKAWQFIDGVRHEIEGDALVPMIERRYFWSLIKLAPLLNAKSCQITRIGEARSGERTLVQIRVKASGHWDYDLFFDNNTHLLAQMDILRPVPGKSEHAVTSNYFESYDDFGGLKYPRRTVRIDPTGARVTEELVEFVLDLPGDRNSDK